jgi:hypothetical protein
MKKILLTSMMSLTLLTASAQCVPFAESGFENWEIIQDSSAIAQVAYTYEKPDTTWMSVTDLFSLAFTGTAFPVVNKSTDSYSGSYSMMMAAPTVESGNLVGQIFYSARPTMYSGYYKYNGLAGDSLIVSVGGNGDTNNTVLLPPVANWTPFSLPINYNTANVPDTFTVVFNLINNGTATINAWLDDLCFGSLPTTSINENTTANNITIYPNPVKDQLNITVENEKINNIKIMDVTGKVLQTFEENLTTINVANLSKGVYFLQIQTDKGIAIKRFIKE